MKRKGQAAGGAVGIVFILAILILVYVLLLPDPAHQEILTGQPGQQGGGGGGGGLVNPSAVLLSQNVGRISPPSPNEVVHDIPSFTIFTTTDATELRRKPTMIVKNGVFSDETANISFVYDPRNTDDLKLSFNVRETGGRLIIYLNGEEIYNSEIENPTVQPITLHSSMLQRDNTLKFVASDPGMAFWKINTHELRNVIVSGKVTNRAGSSAAQHFSVAQSEYEAMQGAELKFLPNCEPSSTGRLMIGMNNREVYSGFADCGVPNTIEIAKELIKPGDNTVTFISERGQYLVDLVKVTSQMEGGNIPVFYFNLPTHIYDRLNYNDALLFVTLRFATAKNEKVGVLNINGFESTFRTPSMAYQTQVNPDFLSPGPNSIMIIPQGTPLDVTELRVEIN